MLSEFLARHQSGIIEDWVHRLHTEVGPQYAARPVAELYGTVSEAAEANYRVIVHHNYTAINKFINKITRMRLEAGFLLSDVQKAFELYRHITVPMLVKTCPQEELMDGIQKVNGCLSYTIHRFSDFFQQMHEREIIEQNRNLENMVQIRTAALAESERKYKTLVEEIADGYIVIQDERIVFANQAFCRMHGYREDDVIGAPFSRFVAPESLPAVLESYQKCLEGLPAPKVFEYQRLSRSGERYATEIQAKITRYDNRLVSIGICRDITERIKMEQRVRENEHMAYIGQITTSLSHEIRNPLSAVKLNLQILNKNARIQGNDQRRIRISTEEVIRLERILTQLLDFAKPIHLKRRLCRIEMIVSTFSELLDLKIKEKNLNFEITFEEQLPRLEVDEEKIGQAIINMLLNAIEASPTEGHIRICIRSSQYEGAAFLAVSVEDEGAGFAEQHRHDIFKPFFTTKTKGTGLGLPNVKRIVEAHGGHMDARNLQPRGAAFCLWLPVTAFEGQ